MDKEAIRRATERLHIQDVYFREALVKMDEDFDPDYVTSDEEQTIEIAAQFRIGTVRSKIDELPSGEKRLRVLVKGGARFLRQSESQEQELEQVALIEAIIVAVYQIIGEEPKQDEIDEFSRHNAVYNVWPYWREHVHTTTLRHRLPPIVMPLFQLAKGGGGEPE